jgi:hypothetical protein
MDEAKGADPAEARQAFDIIFGLLDRIDECRGRHRSFSQTRRGLAGRVPWEKVLPPWLKVLSATAEPEEFAQRFVSLLKHHYDHGSARMLAMARKIATRAQRQALPKPDAQATPRRVTSDDGSTSCGSVRLR